MDEFPRSHTPDTDPLHEQLIRDSYHDPVLFDLNIDLQNWNHFIAGEGGVQNLSQTRRNEWHTFQQRRLGRIEELKEAGIIGSDET